MTREKAERGPSLWEPDNQWGGHAIPEVDRLIGDLLWSRPTRRPHASEKYHKHNPNRQKQKAARVARRKNRK